MIMMKVKKLLAEQMTKQALQPIEMPKPQERPRSFDLFLRHKYQKGLLAFANTYQLKPL